MTTDPRLDGTQPAQPHVTVRRLRLRHLQPPLQVWVAGQGPTILLLHGWALSGGTYRGAIRALAARGMRVVAPSLSVPGTAWSLKASADRAAAALATLGTPPAAVVGHSFGGAVAVQLTLDRPDLPAALVLADAIASPGAVHVLKIVTPGTHWRAAGHTVLPVALLQTAISRHGMRNLVGSTRWLLRGGLDEELARLRELGIPTSVLWASHDRILLPSSGERAAKVLGCRFHAVAADEGWPHPRPPDHDWPFRDPIFFADHVLRELEVIARDWVAGRTVPAAPAVDGARAQTSSEEALDEEAATGAAEQGPRERRPS